MTTASHAQKKGSNTKINVTDRSTNDRIKKNVQTKDRCIKKIGNTVFLGKNCTRGESSKEGKRIGKKNRISSVNKSMDQYGDLYLNIICIIILLLIIIN